VIGEPPFELGDENATLALASAAVTVPMVGAPGGPVGVTDTPADASLVPALFVAVTEQEYVVPFVRFETVIGLAVPVPVRVAAPVAEQVTVYPLMVAPPSFAGAVKEISAVELPAVAAPMAGASGFTAGSVPLSNWHATRRGTAGSSASCRRRMWWRLGGRVLHQRQRLQVGRVPTNCR
jgi:hypothetical protein